MFSKENIKAIVKTRLTVPIILFILFLTQKYIHADITIKTLSIISLFFSFIFLLDIF